MSSPTQRSRNPFRVLSSHRNFRIFWTGQTLSLIGTWMQQMASGWLALELSNSAFVVGVVAAAGSLPILLLSLPAGVLVDRQHKLRLVIVAQTMLLIEATLLWGFTWSGHITIGWLITFATIGGMASAVEIPARQSLMIELVGREDLRDAIALNSSGFNLARIVGPGVAAAIIARFGLAWCFGVNALSYLIVLSSLTMIVLPPWRPAPVVSSPWAGMVDGVRYIRQTPTVRALLQLVAVYSVLGIPYLTLMPVFARDVLGTGAAGFGLMLTCVGIGGLAGALALAAVGAHVRRGGLLRASCYGFAVLLIALSLVRVPMAAYPILLAAGFTMIVNNALANALLQSIIPDALRGRMMAMYSLVVVGLPQVLGAFAAGAIAKVVGVDWTIGGAAAVMLGYGVWAFAKHRTITEA